MEPTMAESLMMTSLMVIARNKPECDGCQWDDPCNQCFASQIVSQLLNYPAFKRWKLSYKITAKRRRKKKEKANA